MITPPQNRLYWRLWSQAKRELMPGRETMTGAEENDRRHELHVRAIGYDKSHFDLTNAEFDKVLAELRAIIDPSDLTAQLRQVDMQKRRIHFGLRAIMKKLNLRFDYVHGIVKQMNANGQLASSRLDVLGVEDLRKVMIALKKHEQRSIA